jgi:predicted dehydrogenase
MSLDPLETVRVGIVGPSWWVNYWHLPALKNHINTEIVAVCGTSERDSAGVEEKYGTNRYFTNYEQMMDSVSLDGVIVCTPNDLHHPVTMAALTRDIHVNTEKPVAMNKAQALEMAQEAANRNLLGLTNFPYRDNPAVQQFREMVAEGFVGDILHVSGSYHGGFGLGRNPNWRSLRERSGSGILGDLGSHLIDLARFMTQLEFSAVSGHTMTALWKEGYSPRLVRTENPDVGERNDDSCTFLAEFEGGAQGIFHTSWVAYQGAAIQQQELEVYGTEGRLFFHASHRGVVLRGLTRGEDHWEEIPVVGTVRPEEASGEEEDYFRPGRNSGTNTTYRWLEAIRTDSAVITPDLWDGYRAQCVIDAVLKSSAERAWVEVEE